LEKSQKGKRGGKPNEGELGFEGLKGWGKEKEGAFFFLWLRLRAIAGRGETDWFTGRSWESSAYVSGSSAFEAS
jgi:hypothetical protein